MCELFDVLFPFNGAKLAINSLSCSISVRKLTKFGKIVSAYLLMLIKIHNHYDIFPVVISLIRYSYI